MMMLISPSLKPIPPTKQAAQRPPPGGWVCAVVLALYLLAGLVPPARAQGPEPFANCRLGVGGVEPDVLGYDLEPLNLGLYLDWWVRDPTPPGLPPGVDYIYTVHVHQDKVGSVWWGPGPYVDPPSYTVAPNLATVANIAANHPGSLWRVGNEIERRDWSNGDGTWGGQNEITPELYATAFHEVQQAIRAADPTARIAIGSVIEATPLRLAYLDRVWDSYLNQYGYSMGQDIDVWIVHGFTLREVRDSWGAEIPAGLDDTSGFLYGASTSEVLAAHLNLAYFRQFTEAMRAWMAAKGERNKPLINTEYGVLYRQLGGIQVTPQQVNDYLTASFDYLLTATDDQTGFPADENRLVQGWVWYSLQDGYWNGNLFDSTTKTLTSAGTTWQGYVSDLAPRQNLLAINLRASPNPAFAWTGNPISVTLKADIANSGNSQTTTGNNLRVSFWDGPPGDPGSSQIGSTQTLNDLPGCGRFTPVEVTWPNLTGGDHTWYVQIEPVANETNPDDNTASSLVSVIENVPQADLAVSKTVDNSAPYTGKRIDYRLTVANQGPDPAFNVVLTDTLPAGVTFDSYAASQGTYGGNGLWGVGTLDSGQSASLTLTVKVNAGQGGQTVTNRATANAVGDDAVAGNDEDSVDIIPVANADLGLFVGVDSSSSRRIVYTLIARNLGPDPATAVGVNHVLPAGLTLESTVASQGSYSPASGGWTVGAVAPGLEARLTITATVDAGQVGQTFNPQAEVSAAEADLEPGNNQASASAIALDSLYLPLVLKSP
ncbi:MAG: DUF11 domain-containing protein [Anaerolineae bacterium]